MAEVDKSDPNAKTEIKFRVMSKVNVLVFSCDHYSEAAKFCQNYDGKDELEIHKVWVPKTAS